MDLINLVNIYNLDNFNYVYNDKIILSSMKIHFTSNEIYEIIINEKKYDSNYFQNKKNNSIISFNILFQKLNIIDTSYIFYVETNCNNCIRIFSDYEYEDTYYNLFDGFANILNKNYELDIYNDISLKNNYIHIYFYKRINNCSIEIDGFTYKNSKNYRNYRKYFFDIYTENNIIKRIEFIRFFIFYVDTKYNIYEKYLNNIYTLKLNIYNNNNNPFDLLCIVNFLKNRDDTLMILFSPIKIIDNSNNYEINFYNKSCKKCNIHKKKR